ncbi:MAG: hypothetical protein IKB56_03975 [Clostridia bacterium]|nr:hypothetical protein [Clostridia bacterium]
MYLLKIKSLCLSKDEEIRNEFLSACKAHAEASKLDEGNLYFNCVSYKYKGATKVVFEELWESKADCDKHIMSAKERPHIAIINKYRDYKEVLKEFEIEEY